MELRNLYIEVSVLSKKLESAQGTQAGGHSDESEALLIEKNILKDERNILQAEKEDLQKRYIAECSLSRDLKQSLAAALKRTQDLGSRFHSDGSSAPTQPTQPAPDTADMQSTSIPFESSMVNRSTDLGSDSRDLGLEPTPLVPSPAQDSSLELALRAAIEEGMGCTYVVLFLLRFLIFSFTFTVTQYCVVVTFPFAASQLPYIALRRAGCTR